MATLAEHVLSEMSAVGISEASWGERFGAGKYVYDPKYADSYVHFSDIPKLGINPKKRHGDPHGVFFYPVSWLKIHMRDHQYQFATSKPYFFLAEIDKHGPGVFDLMNVRWDVVKSVANRNGWGKYLEAAKQGASVFSGSGSTESPIPRGVRRKSGAFFYGTADLLANSPKVFETLTGVTVDETWTWSKLLRGVKAMFDTGGGIINTNEPYQVVVIDPRAYRLVVQGENKQKDFPSTKYVVEKVMADLGGSIDRVESRKFHCSLTIDGAPIRLVIGYLGTEVRAYYIRKGNVVAKDFNFSYDVDVSIGNQYLAERISSILKYRLGELGAEPGQLKVSSDTWSLDRLSEFAYDMFPLRNTGESFREFVMDDGTQTLTVSRRFDESQAFVRLECRGREAAVHYRFKFSDFHLGDIEYNRDDIRMDDIKRVLGEFYATISQDLRSLYKVYFKRTQEGAYPSLALSEKTWTEQMVHFMLLDKYRIDILKVNQE